MRGAQNADSKAAVILNKAQNAQRRFSNSVVTKLNPSTEKARKIAAVAVAAVQNVAIYF